MAGLTDPNVSPLERRRRVAELVTHPDPRVRVDAFNFVVGQLARVALAGDATASPLFAAGVLAALGEHKR